ncbi:MAG TPA: IPExxxVDY family protein [Bacteroidales bacterium]|nr:IPExxxVDY family protein [Bacteroidales bacterium]HSA42190.1 IPExxxVDY family protein [Bacteroidales bacterium]
MVKKHYLDPPDEPDYKILGIATAMKDYRLAYYLNRELYLDLKRSEDLEVSEEEAGSGLTFSFFKDDKGPDEISYYLLTNRNRQGVLLPDLRESDFFLLIRGLLPGSAITRILKTIRQIPNVLTAYSVQAKRNKKVTALFSEVELHIMQINQQFRLRR